MLNTPFIPIFQKMSMSQTSSRSASPARQGQQQMQDLSGAKPMKPNNGWTREQEDLMAGWSDIASCYRWMHDRCEKIMAKNNMMITVPVIILSTLTGSANFITSSLVGDDAVLSKYTQIGIGGVSIFTGILTTLGNFFRYAQSSEAHRVSSIAWGKFQRQLAVELALHPRERIECMDFLKICRAELDRMIEQSPPIPDKVIEQFELEFKDNLELKRPDIAHGMDHTKVFVDKDTRLKQLAADAAVFLQQKRKTWHTAMMPDVDRHVDKKLQTVVADLSGNHLMKLQEKVLQLERIVQEQAEQNQQTQSKYTSAGRTSYRTFLRENSDVVRPFQPASNAHRRLSVQMRPSVNTGDSSQISFRLPNAKPPFGGVNTLPFGGVKIPPTPLQNKTIDLTLPGEIKTTSDDLISALVQPRTLPENLKQQPVSKGQGEQSTPFTQQTGFEPKE